MPAALPAPALRFNPRPRLRTLEIGPDRVCLVVDDALLDPDAWVAHAAARRADFAERAGNAYPGPELALAEAVLESLDGFFAVHARRPLGGRRTLRRSARLSLATRSAEQLVPRQWLCHVDRLDVEPGQNIAASVLYLFKDPALGGTAFYRPRRPAAEIGALVQASASLPPAEFSARYGLAPGYMTRDNDWFGRVAAVPARFNRLIFYPGNVFHSADIERPDLLHDDPARGRLTMNGFYICRKRLA